mmetsp:Transcript_66/g.166  ORF Transcript_66/g.166 Transcript_66/m.166 type:complete len:247 (-) Transcript_66:1374-2114(-)
MVHRERRIESRNGPAWYVQADAHLHHVRHLDPAGGVGFPRPRGHSEGTAGAPARDGFSGASERVRNAGGVQSRGRDPRTAGRAVSQVHQSRVDDEHVQISVPSHEMWHLRDDQERRAADLRSLREWFRVSEHLERGPEGQHPRRHPGHVLQGETKILSQGNVRERYVHVVGQRQHHLQRDHAKGTGHPILGGPFPRPPPRPSRRGLPHAPHARLRVLHQQARLPPAQGQRPPGGSRRTLRLHLRQR